jgi:hypothetical protein
MYLNPLPFKPVTLNADRAGDFVIVRTFPVAVCDAVFGFVTGIQNRL